MIPSIDKVRFLLLQARRETDPIRGQEVHCFAGAFDCSERQFDVVDLLTTTPSASQLLTNDLVLIGGSGDFSVTMELDWLERALDLFRELHAQAKPTFGSCWGFQALAKAMGGRVVRDLDKAELGTRTACLTPSGERDPVLGPCGRHFRVYIGHEDRVADLPADADSLAATDLVDNQALKFHGKPIYGTQFHPELNRATFLDRVYRYPKYVEQITGLEPDQFAEQCLEIPNNHDILQRFARFALG
jgi:GMP synthase (glutamine-hydrolysing)